ncbi:MAG: hypothetical protein ACQESP_02315 [Candidatus Muiribacteriota bacterium]
MIKKIFVFFFLFFVLVSILKADSNPTHRVHLVDGSVINVRLIEFKEETYLFYSSILGNISITDDLISKLESIKGKKQSNSKKKQSIPDISGLQSQIMSDLSMEDLEGLMSNEAVEQILNDPEIMGIIMSGDYEKLYENEKFMGFMKSGEIKELLNLFER